MKVPERTEAPTTRPTVGIVGAGQLARMLCEAASALGVATFVLAENADDAATPTAGDVAIGSPRDPAALAALAARCDVVTFDHELVDLDTVAALEAQGAAVRPGSAALRAAVDKAHQRRDFRAAGLPVPDFAVLGGTAAEDRAALESLARRSAGHPVVKAARGGYDGRGVVLARTFDEAVDAALAWRAEGTVVVAEAPCRFRAELAALVARRPNGDTVAWRPVETAQLDGICREVRVPGTVDDPTAKEATDLALRVADHLGVVGVLAVELFDTHDGLVVNEVATRPHNSGHWTIEGATTSQFENHLRAVLDLPLGSTELRAPAVVSVNVLGGEHGDPSAVAAALAVPQAKVHLYGKSWRPGRKLGHVTVVGEDPDGVAAAAWRAATALGNPMPPGRTVPS